VITVRVVTSASPKSVGETSGFAHGGANRVKRAQESNFARGEPRGAIVMPLQRTPTTRLDRRQANRLEGQRDHVSG